MSDDRRAIFRAFYRRLLTFYPRPFRERFGESMSQTFDDICRENDGRTEKLLSLTIRFSVDTGVGIVREQVLYLSQRGTMRGLLHNQLFAAIVGMLLFLPGAAMFVLLVFGIGPEEIPVRLFGIEASSFPLAGYLQPAGDGPHILGSLIALGVMLVLPAIGVMINIAAAEGSFLKAFWRDVGIAAIIGAVLVLPLMALQLTMGRASYSTFPKAVFIILWLLPTALAVLTIPVIRDLRAGKGLFANPVALAFRLAFFALIAAFWLGLVNDQMPCFLGVPNCD